MNITEIFYSIQGEGLKTGCPTIFIRLGGCNKNCWFCDTSDKETTKMSCTEIVAEVNKYNCNNICITGGEPTIQSIDDVIDLLSLSQKYLSIETNGSNYISCLNKFNHITVSPKGWFDKRFLKIASEFKHIVYRDVPNFLETKAIQYLQPVYGDSESLSICVEAVKYDPRFRLGTQIHKYLGVY